MSERIGHVDSPDARNQSRRDAKRQTVSNKSGKRVGASDGDKKPGARSPRALRDG